MYRDYPSAIDAQLALTSSGITEMKVELLPVMGGRIQPVVICEFESDLKECNRLGFNARLENDYAYDG